MGLISDFIAGRTPPALYEEYLTPGFFTPWTESLIAQAPPRGQVLDVASGTGGVSRALARHDPALSIQAIDVAPPMIAFAEAETVKAGLSDRITYIQASADQLPFDAARFDCAYCQQGLQFFPDKVAALAEIKRVLAPGATLALSVWTSAANGNLPFAALEDIVSDRLGNDLVPFGPFAYGDINAIRDTAEQAGFSIVSLEQQDRMTRLPTPRILLLFDLLFLGRPADDGSLQPLFDPSDESKDPLIEELITAFEAATAPYMQADGTLFCPSTANVLVATH